MDALNYQHLRYFWMVAREGGLVQAARALRLSHPTLSAQIHALEDRLGERLFTRVGRRLALTEAGRVAQRYAEEIFGLGSELVDAVQGRSAGKPLRLDAGVVDALPKLVVHRLLQPALSLPTPVRLVCRDGDFAALLADLSTHALDVVLADGPVPPGSAVRAHHHLLGECGVSLFAAPALARRLKGRFPASLDGAPLLVPAAGHPLRRSVDAWLARRGLRPRVVAEVEDSALLLVFGADGAGVFPAPAAVDREVAERYGAVRLGEAEGAVERFYAISMARRLEHPAVQAISRAARGGIFAGSGKARRGPRHLGGGPDAA